MVSKAEILSEAAKVVEESRAPVTEITLSNGLRLGLKPVPLFLIQKAAARLKKPLPPRIYIEEKEREEDNPSDPAYLEAVGQWEAQTVEIGMNVLLVAGTEVLEVPPGIFPVESDEWLELLQFFEVEANLETKLSRYLTWLTCYAIPSAEDLANTMQQVMTKSGIAEEEVNDTLNTFRNRATRRANNGVPAKVT